ncbi:hypothetical protein FJZ31_00925 [Candidatus Poribacteria bacterium]|nr:hypothetical protein [Candidatus Poribacteria bacterium]
MIVYQLIQKRIAPLLFAITIMLIFFCFFTKSLWAGGQPKTLTISFSKSPSTYLPIENDLITVNATTNPIQAGVQVTFTLTQSYQFSFSDGTTTPKTATTNSSGVASVTIKSLTYYGVAKVRVTATNYTGDEKQIPIDTDNDLIANSWEQTYGGTAPNYLDPNADNETVSGITQTGDGFTVLNEYKGYRIPGLGHSRMNPTQKEVFYHVNSSATGATFAKNGLSSLGLTVITPASGNPITFLGSESRDRIYASKSGSFSTTTDGDWWNLNGTSKGDTGVMLGRATLGGYYANPRDAVAAVYETAISNLYTLNQINEVAFSNPTISVSGIGGDVTWDAVFNGQDLNGDGDNFDAFNAFDIMSPVGQPNDMTGGGADGILFSLTQSQALNKAARHEVGHTVGIDHATTLSSVMRAYLGPAMVDTFTSSDKQQVRLK